MIIEREKKVVFIRSKQIKNNIAEGFEILSSYDSFQVIPDLVFPFFFKVVISLAINIVRGEILDDDSLWVDWEISFLLS